jgi:cell division protein FtsB
LQSKPFPLPARLLILALAGYAAATLLSLRPQLQDAQAETAQLCQQLDEAEQDVAALEQALAAAETVEGLTALVRSHFGFVREDELIFRVSGS